ncbi:hypothetical protein NQ318_018619 [Aromia moschata]|uniref:Uncharacterized protein n=1 Tax=Aromia moschata TaxID=1265417 RepID=A0AAV8ZII5_9CUCU|nr:hypothetical protein NQ318_018619 [Aromia moschata]
MIKANDLAITQRGSENRQNVRQNIRKIIQRYKRKQMDETYIPPQKEEAHTKETIKKIIEEERSRQEKEEITKIQQQIMELIENNPNIVNKELIKVKLQETVIKELVDVIDHKAQGEGKPKTVNADEKIELPKDKLEKKYSEETKKAETVPKVLENVPLKIVVVEQPVIIKEGKHKLPVMADISPSKVNPKDYSRSDEDYEVGEQGSTLDLYESPVSSRGDESGTQIDKQKNEATQYDNDKLVFIKRFKKANEKLDNILTIIDEIVDTIEITDEDDETFSY